MTDGGSSRWRGAMRTVAVAVGTLVAGWVTVPNLIILNFTSSGFGVTPTTASLVGDWALVIGVPLAALVLTVWLERLATGLVGFLVGVGTSVLMLGLF